MSSSTGCADSDFGVSIEALDGFGSEGATAIGFFSLVFEAIYAAYTRSSAITPTRIREINEIVSIFSQQ